MLISVNSLMPYSFFFSMITVIVHCMTHCFFNAFRLLGCLRICVYGHHYLHVCKCVFAFLMFIFVHVFCSALCCLGWLFSLTLTALLDSSHCTPTFPPSFAVSFPPPYFQTFSPLLSSPPLLMRYGDFS